MKFYKLFFILSWMFTSFFGVAQVGKDSLISSSLEPKAPVVGNLETREIFKRKGNFFFYWGYNRSAYTTSDIHFWGDGYDFTIHDVEAKDEPTTTFKTYIGPTSFTVPEYNYRLGYFLNDKTFISIGEDHMKYHIVKQAVRLNGSITYGSNIGNYDNTEVLVGEGRLSGHLRSPGNSGQVHHGGNGGGSISIIDSLPKGFVSNFEHCDGLNDASLEFGRIEQLWISKNTKHALIVTGTIGSGLVIPDSDASVLGQLAYHNQEKKTYHLAGYSFSASIGVQFDFCKHFFLQTKLKGGYINLSDIKTTIGGGKASQHFGFIEPMFVAGYTHPIGKH